MQHHFKCKRCGECCRSPRLYNKDIQRIKQAGYTDFIFTDNFGNHYMKERDGWCMFLKRGKVSSCKIYSYRPKTCRLYPNGFLGFVEGDCKPVELAFDKYLEKKKTI